MGDRKLQRIDICSSTRIELQKSGEVEFVSNSFGGDINVFLVNDEGDAEEVPGWKSEVESSAVTLADCQCSCPFETSST